MKLHVYYKERKVFQMKIESNPFVIGRSGNCDLILSGDKISRRHIEIYRQSQHFLLKDLSQHGWQFEGEQKYGSYILEAGQSFGLNDWRISLVTSREPKKESFALNEKTEVTKIDLKATTQIIDAQSVDSNSFKGDPTVFIESPMGMRERIRINKSSFMIGSSTKSSDIVLNDPFVSARHAQLEKTIRGLVIYDKQSTNGIWFGDSKIQERLLVDGDELKLGGTRLQFFYSEADVLKGRLERNGYGFLIGRSKAMQNLYSSIEKAAQTDLPTLILGETGSGKELVAGAIHSSSARRGEKIVAINCGAISPHLIESELFGHEKGAFTGAVQRHSGVFEQAHSGTLFLDEVGELPPAMQAKLLRVLETGSFRRVGGQDEVQTDVRVIAATHQNLMEKIKTRRFREDLFYRLYVLSLSIPPLRQRESDLQDLVTHFLRENKPFEKSFVLSSAATEKLMGYHWPGNVRELKNTLWRAMTMCHGQLIEASDIHFIMPHADTDFRKSGLSKAEEQNREIYEIREALKICDGDKTQAAKYLGMGRSTLFRKIKAYKAMTTP